MKSTKFKIEAKKYSFLCTFKGHLHMSFPSKSSNKEIRVSTKDFSTPFLAIITLSSAGAFS
jgi:hypothetical protein